MAPGTGRPFSPERTRTSYEPRSPFGLVERCDTVKTRSVTRKLAALTGKSSRPKPPEAATT